MVFLSWYILLVVSHLALLGATSRPARFKYDIEGRQIIPCEVACGGGWCCDVSETCQVSKTGDPYVCIDTQLTNSDGSFITWPAFDDGGLGSAVSTLNSLFSTYNFTLSTQRITVATPTLPTLSPPTQTQKTAVSTATSAASAQAGAMQNQGVLWSLAIAVLWALA